MLQGATPLIMACMAGHCDIADQLISHSASVHAADANVRFLCSFMLYSCHALSEKARVHTADADVSFLCCFILCDCDCCQAVAVNVTVSVSVSVMHCLRKQRCMIHTHSHRSMCCASKSAQSAVLQHEVT